MSENFRTIKKIVPIDHIVPNPWNPNIMDSTMFAKAKKSLEELGMLGSILVRETAGVYEILDGEHRWKVAKELGYKELPVESMGEITDSQAKFLTIHINNLHGSDDIHKRAKIIQEMEEGQLSLLPFSAEQIANEKAFISWDFSQYDKEVPIDREVHRLIQIEATEEEFQVWRTCIKEATKEGKTEIQVLVEMMEHFLSLRLGSAPGQRTQVIATQ